jgi:hypothetical protein
MTWWSSFVYHGDDVSTWILLISSTLLAITYGLLYRRRL